MDYIKIILRISFFYMFIILIYRLMGKREVGQLGIIDLIVSILIADIVTISIEKLDKSIMISVVPILCLVVFEIGLSLLSLRSGKVRTLLDGNPAFIISNGKINYGEMVKQKYNLDDLLTQLREKGYRNIEEIEYAILENSGTLSVFPYNSLKTNTPLPMAVILDGKIQDDIVKKIGKGSGYIKELLNKKKILLDDIFYAFYKDKSMYVIKYSDLKK